MYRPRVSPRCAAAGLAAALLFSPLCAAWAQQPPAAPSVAPAANQLAVPNAAGAALGGNTQPVAEYRLGAGDVIRITVYQNADLSFETRVSDNGLLSYPLLGALKVGGLTVTELEQLIAEGLRKGEFVKQPQVTVVLMQVRGYQVSVLGQVQRAGRFPLEQANTRLSDVLAQAGGIIPLTGADLVTVIGKRNDKPFRLEIDLPRIFAADSATVDVVLQNNDVIWVDRAPQFYIYGEVQRAGAFRLERGMTLMQGLAAGGGLTQRGTEKGIRVHRKGAARTEVLQPGMDDSLRDGDVIYVRESLF